jgi:hypothetical protein
MALIQEIAARTFKGGDATGGAKATFAAPVTAGNAIVVYFAVERLATPTLGLLLAVQSRIGGSLVNTWAIAEVQSGVSTSGSTAQTEAGIAVALNVAAGTTEIALTFVNAADNVVTWKAEEHSNVALTGAINGKGKVFTANDSTDTTTSNTAPLVTTDDVAFSVIAGMFLGGINGDPVQAPSAGWTTTGYELSGTILDDKAPAQFQRRQLTSASALNVGWTHYGAGQGTAAVLVTLKSRTVTKRIRITNIDETYGNVDGTTGWTVYWIPQDGTSGTFYKKAGITAEASGQSILVTDSNVPNFVAGTEITCFAGRPGASPVDGLVFAVVGTIEDVAS